MRQSSNAVSEAYTPGTHGFLHAKHIERFPLSPSFRLTVHEPNAWHVAHAVTRPRRARDGGRDSGKKATRTVGYSSSKQFRLGHARLVHRHLLDRESLTRLWRQSDTKL